MTDQVVVAPEVLPVTPTTTPVNAVVNAPAAGNEVKVQDGSPAAPTLLTPAVVNVPADFPDTWRDKLAGGDAKEAQRLARFTDPTAVWKAYRELENKVATGAFKAPLAKGATEEQVAQYRKDNGIPATAQEYDLQLSDGVVLGEDDEPVLNHVLEVAHANNLPPAVVNQLVDEMMIARNEVAQQKAEEQKVIRYQSEELLRAKWGNNFTGNIMAAKNFLTGAGEFGDMLATAKLSDGSIFGNSAKALEWLAGVALDLNPAGTVVPGGTANQAQAIDEELKTFADMRSKDIQGWHKNKAAKSRELELLEAKQKIQARGY